MPKKEDALTAKNLRERSDAELRSLMASKSEELHRQSFKHRLGQLRETHTINAIKRDLARLNTILGERSRTQASKS